MTADGENDDDDNGMKLKMYEKGKKLMGKYLRSEIEDMWTPLREIQAEDAAIKKANEEAGLGSEYAR